jgi:hypothetical protein
MPPPELQGMVHKAQVWACVGRDSHGQPLIGSLTPEEVECRWVPKTRQITDPQGNPLTIDVQVRVENAVEIGSAMWLGSYEDLEEAITGTDTTDLVPETDIYEVVMADESADVRGEFVSHVLGLKWRGDTLPALSS